MNALGVLVIAVTLVMLAAALSTLIGAGIALANDREKRWAK